MAIIIGKLLKKTFENKNGSYHIYWFRKHGGECCSAIFTGVKAPIAFKTVEYTLFGDWVKHKKYGKQFKINKFKRSNIKNTEQLNQSKILLGAVKSLGKN